MLGIACFFMLLKELKPKRNVKKARLKESSTLKGKGEMIIVSF
jgi:hypothetical protein